MDLTPFREQLAAEIAGLRARADAYQTVLDAAEAVDDVHELVRPPADGVPAEPVTIPKRQAKEQREAKPAARQSKHDWPAIAEEVKRAAAAGEPIAKALAAKFGVTNITAGWMVGRCRELGLTEYVRKPKASRKPMVAVSQAVSAAEQLAEPPKPDPLAVPDRHSAPGNPSVFARTTKVLACTEDGCEFTCDPDRAIDLRTHAIGAHGRRPTDEERTPVVRGAAA